MSLFGLLIFTVALKQSKVTDKNAMYLICSIRTEIIQISIRFFGQITRVTNHGHCGHSGYDVCHSLIYL